MSDIAINPVTRRVQFTGNTGTGPFAFTFNILADSDIAVYKGTVLLTLTTDYTVSINANGTGPRSEEHTSELQSRLHLVCRLLLEKKKYSKIVMKSQDLTMEWPL